MKVFYLVVAEWRLYAPINTAIVGSENGAWSGCQAIISTNAMVLLIDRAEEILVKFEWRYNSFH